MAATIGYAQLHGLRYAFRPWPYEPYFSLENCFTSRLHTWHDYTDEAGLFRPIPRRRSINLTGYFQSEKYFAHCKPLIRKLLTPKGSFPPLPGVASIHVRRGDYLDLESKGLLQVLGMDYYERAMEALPVDRFLVFSTDMDWCRDHFIGNRFTFVEGGTQEEDLAQMAACEHNIIANSSFSWWAAWLNTFPNKRVMAPNRWAGPARASWYDLTHKLPEDWERIG